MNDKDYEEIFQESFAFKELFIAYELVRRSIELFQKSATLFEAKMLKVSTNDERKFHEANYRLECVKNAIADFQEILKQYEYPDGITEAMEKAWNDSTSKIDDITKEVDDRLEENDFLSPTVSLKTKDQIKNTYVQYVETLRTLRILMKGRGLGVVWMDGRILQVPNPSMYESLV
jgi:hypothetical protein